MILGILLVLVLLFPSNTAFGFWWLFEDKVDNEQYCFDLFADYYDLMYDVMFYMVIFDLPYNTNFDESNVPVDLRNSLMNDLELLKADFTEYGCENYRYLLEDDEYLKWRYDNLEYHVSLLLYHSESYHQQSKVGQYLDEIEEHKDLIKFFLPLLFG